METIQQVKDATIRLLIKYGYDKTTMSDVAKEANVGRSTIYTKWKTKEVLFEYVLLEETINYVDAWWEKVEADPEGGTFTGIYKNALMVIRNNPIAYAIYTHDREILGKFIDHQQFSQILIDRIWWSKKLLQMLQGANLIRSDIDIQKIASVAFIFRQGLLNTNFIDLNDHLADYEDIIDLFVNMFRDFLNIHEDQVASDIGKRLLKQYIDEFKDKYISNLDNNVD